MSATTKKGKQWVKLREDFQGFHAGEKIKVGGTDAKSLIEQNKAVEAKDPAAKLIKKACREIAASIGGTVTEQTKKALEDLQKGIDEAKKAFPHGLGPVAGNGAGTGQFDVGNTPGISAGWGTDGLRYKAATPALAFGSGCGMGEFLGEMALSLDHPDKRKALCEKYKVDYLSLDQMIGTKAALAESSGVTGGYTVPTEYAMRLMQLVIQQSVVRPRATIIPMAARSIRIPALDVTTTQAAGVTAFLGGLQAYWQEEAQARTETEPQFKQIELVAHELTGYTLASNTVLADNAVALDALLTRLFSQAISWFSDFAFLQGTGAGKPLGILNAPASYVQSRGTGSTFKLADAANMMSRLLTTSFNSSVWIMSQTVLPQLVQLADAANRVIWLPNASSPGGGAAQTLPATLFGLPIIFTEKLPALGTKGDVMLADLSYYLIGDRMQIEIASSPHFKFQNNQMAWRFISRVDGQPWLDNTVQLADGATAVSPFVVLNT